MSYRLERVAHAIRDVVSDAIANRLSDPRISRFTSITRVEVSGDLRHAQIYVSVMGTDAEGTTTMKGLESARGMVQSLLAKRLDLRTCPSLQFHLDRGLKQAAQIIRQIDEALGRTAGVESVISDDADSDSPDAAGAHT